MSGWGDLLTVLLALKDILKEHYPPKKAFPPPQGPPPPEPEPYKPTPAPFPSLDDTAGRSTDLPIMPPFPYTPPPGPPPGTPPGLADVKSDDGESRGPSEDRQREDPLIVDLDGNGISTQYGSYFDHDANGFSEVSGCPSCGDGFLAMDRNGNGHIENGRELFGDQTVLKDGTLAENGFQALAELDDNHDGKIDAADTAFSRLRVWADLAGDGYGALYTLEELGITVINLDSTVTNVTDAQGNTQTRIGSFEKANGTTGQIAEYLLQRDTMSTIANEWLPVPDDIAALPNLRGYGNVYDLHQAMVRDSSGELKSLVEQFASASNPTSRNALMGQILFAWTGSDSIGSLNGVRLDIWVFSCRLPIWLDRLAFTIQARSTM